MFCAPSNAKVVVFLYGKDGSHRQKGFSSGDLAPRVAKLDALALFNST